MSYEKLQKGDIVSVNFNNARYTLCDRGVIKYMPTCSGDAWVVEDMETGLLHYITEPCTITKWETKAEGK